MKYIKTFEKLNKYIEAGIIEIIKNQVGIYSEDGDIDFNCPFFTELAIIHQKDYITEIYDSVKDENSVHSEEMKDITLKYFTEVYNKLLKKAPDTILKYLKKEPKWFQEWMDGYEDLDIPDWIINAKKYNL